MEAPLETVLSVYNLTFLIAIDSRSETLSSVYPGIVAASAGHTMIGHAVETLMYTVAVEMDASLQRTPSEILALLARFFDVESLEVWRMVPLSIDATQISCLDVAVHRFLKHSSPFEQLEPGIVSTPESGTVLFLLVSEYDLLETWEPAFSLIAVIVFLQLSDKDMGATRITNVDWNLLIASTNLFGWTAQAVDARSSPKLVRTRQENRVQHRNVASFAPFKFANPMESSNLEMIL